MADVSFENDIMPLFKQFKGQMVWRFDLTCYSDMRANAQTVYARISDAPMPPPLMGARLGLEMGALAITIGLSLGAVIGYYSGWHLGYPLVRRYVSEEQQRILRDLESRFSYLALAMVRAVPVLAEASILAADAARLKPRPVFITLLNDRFHS